MEGLRKEGRKEARKVHEVLCLPRNLHVEVLKVLCLSRNLHVELHKVLCLSGTLRIKVHKALYLSRNLHVEVHKVLRLPRSLHVEVHQVPYLSRNLHVEVHKALRLPRNLHFEVHQVLCLPRNLHNFPPCFATGGEYFAAPVTYGFSAGADISGITGRVLAKESGKCALQGSPSAAPAPATNLKTSHMSKSRDSLPPCPKCRACHENCIST